MKKRIGVALNHFRSFRAVHNIIGESGNLIRIFGNGANRFERFEYSHKLTSSLKVSELPRDFFGNGLINFRYILQHY